MKKFPLLLLVIVAFAGGGCAPADHSFDEEGAFDPVEPINRTVYGFNKKADFFIMRPMAKVYDDLPPFSKNAMGNFYANLGEPKNIVNHLLQKRGDDAVRSVARLVFNSTFGFGGLTDIATDMDIPKRENDFGQTLRAYAGNGGAYIVLPFLGPSSVADAPGKVVDGFFEPYAYLSSTPTRAGLGGVKVAKTRAEFLAHEDLLESALDEYSYVRDVAEEFRRRDTPSDVWGEPDNIWKK